jgi:type III secretory pathway component EscV
MPPSTKQATVVAIFYLLLVGVIAVVALHEYAIDDFLKVWAVLGTLVGVLTGAVPSYFFAVTAGAAKEKEAKAEERAQTILGVADSDALKEAKQLRPDLFK